GLITLTNPAPNTFQVTFDGSLRGIANTLSAATVGSNAVAPAITTVQAVIGATSVTANAALELAGGVTYTGETLNTLNGVGFNAVPTGALRLADTNPAAAETATWNGNVVLALATALGVQGASDTLVLGGPGQPQ